MIASLNRSVALNWGFIDWEENKHFSKKFAVEAWDFFSPKCERKLNPVSFTTVKRDVKNTDPSLGPSLRPGKLPSPEHSNPFLIIHWVTLPSVEIETRISCLSSPTPRSFSIQRRCHTGEVCLPPTSLEVKKGIKKAQRETGILSTLILANGFKENVKVIVKNWR